VSGWAGLHYKAGRRAFSCSRVSPAAHPRCSDRAPAQRAGLRQASVECGGTNLRSKTRTLKRWCLPTQSDLYRSSPVAVAPADAAASAAPAGTLSCCQASASAGGYCPAGDTPCCCDDVLQVRVEDYQRPQSATHGALDVEDHFSQQVETAAAQTLLSFTNMFPRRTCTPPSRLAARTLPSCATRQRPARLLLVPVRRQRPLRHCPRRHSTCRHQRQSWPGQ